MVRKKHVATRIWKKKGATHPAAVAFFRTAGARTSAAAAAASTTPGRGAPRESVAGPLSGGNWAGGLGGGSVRSSFHSCKTHNIGERRVSRGPDVNVPLGSLERPRIE